MSRKTIFSILLLAFFFGCVTSQENQTNPSIKTRIFGGRVANDNEFPHYVKIQSASTLCGGTIIHKNWVLTAAHCVKDNNGQMTYGPGDYVIVRTHKYTNNINQLGDAVKKAIKVIPHSDYSAKIGNDLALIQVGDDLLKPLSNGFQPRPAALPNPGESFIEKDAIIAGTGRKDGNKHSEELRTGNVKIVNSQLCDKYIASGGRNVICTGHPEGKQGICHGDSGSGLIFNDAKRGPVVIGVSSDFATIPHADDCIASKQKAPIEAGFTEVAAFLPWIKQYVK